jgi:hypothetical protein
VSNVSFKQILYALDESRGRLLLFGALSAFLLILLAPAGWNANEEEYFQMAHRAVAPEAFHRFDAAADSSRAQFVPKAILGTLVEWCGYEAAHDITRIGMALLYAFGLTVLFSALRIGALDALLILTVFVLLKEELIGGEWLFRGIEFKTIAYSILFVAFGMAVRARWRMAIALGSVATYMHFLVGGFWSAMLLLLQWREQGFKHPPLRTALAYAASATPLLAIIFVDQFPAEPVASGELSADVIYSAIRNPHHVAPFHSVAAFLSWLPGLIAVVCLAAVLAVLQHHGMLSLAGVAAFWGTLFLLGAFVISYFDRHTYLFGKFYLFRPSSLTLLFALTAILPLLQRLLPTNVRLIWMLGATSIVTAFSLSVLKMQANDALRPDQLPYVQSLIAAIEANSQPDDIVLLEPYQEMSAKYAILHREIPRPTLVSWKFVPSNRVEILRWYALIQARDQLFVGGCGGGIALEPKPALLVTFTADSAERVGDCGPVVWNNGAVQLTKVAR